MTGLQEDPDKAVSMASATEWLVEHWHVAPQPITKTLREMFGLTFNEAVKVLVAARRLHDAMPDVADR